MGFLCSYPSSVGWQIPGELGLLLPSPGLHKRKNHNEMSRYCLTTVLQLWNRNILNHSKYIEYDVGMVFFNWKCFWTTWDDEKWYSTQMSAYISSNEFITSPVIFIITGLKATVDCPFAAKQLLGQIWCRVIWAHEKCLWDGACQSFTQTLNAIA